MTATVRPRPIVIAHRGACGYLPEHTLASYFLAIEHGADYIEPDLVFTRDGVLVARHENEIGGTTDVAERPQFARRRTARQVDGVEVSGWFCEDFTLAELKSLRARERLPQLRPANTRFDRMFEVPTFSEILELVRAAEQRRRLSARQQGRPAPPRIGIYPETKHPSYFEALGFQFDAPLLGALRRYGYDSARSPIYIQSFEVGNLRRLRGKTRLRLVQLIDSDGQPFDLQLRADCRSYAELMSAAGLQEIAGYANVIAPDKEMVVTRAAAGNLGADTGLARRAAELGLGTHVWTLRAENEYLPASLRAGDDPSALGAMAPQIAALLAAGVSGLFADQADLAVAARDAWYAARLQAGRAARRSRR